MGVALIESTSRPARSFFIFSLWRTPKRCSSSITSSPKSLKTTESESMACVPMSTSILPAASCAFILSASAFERKRESISTTIGYPPNLRRKFIKCCWHRTVVGQRTAACLPLMAHLKTALIAISVLPKPTSAHSSLSIGFSDSMSAFTSAAARSWSGVSAYSKESSKSLCHSSSSGKANPFAISRRDCISSSSAA